MNSERPEVAAAACADATIVIVGAGQAGGWAAQTLRKEGFAGRLVLIGDELHPPHERPPLSKAVLAGEARAGEHAAAEARGLRGARARVATGRAGDADRSRRQAARAGRRRDARLRQADPVHRRPRPHAVRSWRRRGRRAHAAHHRRCAGARADARAGQRVVVIGGGWIGLEVAATARKKGADVIVVEAQSRLCERTVPRRDLRAPAGAAPLAWHARDPRRRRRAASRTDADGRPVRHARRRQRTRRATPSSSASAWCPTTNWRARPGWSATAACVVDARCRTSDPDILAAGDVAVTPNPWAGRRLRLESWQNAQEQGIAAARSALGLAGRLPAAAVVLVRPVRHEPADLRRARCHRTASSCAATPGSDSFVLFYLDGDVVKAALGPNAARDLRFARRLIEQRKPVDPQRLADVGVPMSKL